MVAAGCGSIDKLSDLLNLHKTHKASKTRPHKPVKPAWLGFMIKPGFYASPVLTCTLLTFVGNQRAKNELPTQKHVSDICLQWKVSMTMLQYALVLPYINALIQKIKEGFRVLRFREILNICDLILWF